MVQHSPYANVPVATQPLYEMLLKAVKKHGRLHPNKPAIVSAEDPAKFITYSEIYEKSLRVISFLTKLAFGHKDMMGLVLPNCFEFVYLYIGAIRCGGAITGASALFTDYEMERQFLEARCKIVVTDGDHLDKVRKAAKNCPFIKSIICIRRREDQQSTDVMDFEELIKTPITPHKLFDGSMEDVAVVPFSSGTTGSPKGVMISHKNFATMMTILVDHFEKLAAPKLRPNSDWSWYNQSLFIFLPFYHDYGFSLLHMCLLTGMTAVVANRFDAHVFLSSVEKYKIEILFCVPPTVLFLTKYEELNKYDLSHIRIVVCAGAALGKELAEEFLQIHKNAIISGAYGLTECSLASHWTQFNREDGYETVGFPMATYQMKITDPDTGKELPNGTKGEICLKSPTVMLGYLNKPEATAEVIDKEGWMRTGDIGYIDEKGHTRIVERLKEVIKVNGRQVSPSELEDALVAQSDILDAAVIGIPHHKYGEIPKAFIVRNDYNVSERSVEKIIKERFAVYKWLKGGVEFVEMIPKSPSGKILRRFLREQSISKI